MLTSSTYMIFSSFTIWSGYCCYSLRTSARSGTVPISLFLVLIWATVGLWNMYVLNEDEECIKSLLSLILTG